MARSNRPSGLTSLHERPWGDADFEHPLVEGIDFPRVLVSEARWLADRNTLVVEILPGHNAPSETTFRIKGLKPGAKWTLIQDGDQIGSLGPDNVASGAIREGPPPDSMTISRPWPLERDWTFVACNESAAHRSDFLSRNLVA